MGRYDGILLLTDVDGTLVSADGTISQENQAAIKSFTSQGGGFAVASGRSQKNVASYFPYIKLTAPSILYNGAVLYDFAANTPLLCEYLPNRLQMEDYVVNCMQQHSTAYFEVFSLNEIYRFTSWFPPVYRETTKAQTKACVMGELAGILWIKIVICDEHQNLLEYIDEIKRSFGDGVFEFSFSSSTRMGITKIGVSKGSMLKKLRSIDELGKKRIVAVGDYDNDIEMLLQADMGIAVGNACDSLKQIADIITVDNEHSAIACVINTLL